MKNCLMANDNFCGFRSFTEGTFLNPRYSYVDDVVVLGYVSVVELWLPRRAFESCWVSTSSRPEVDEWTSSGVKGSRQQGRHFLLWGRRMPDVTAVRLPQYAADFLDTRSHLLPSENRLHQPYPLILRDWRTWRTVNGLWAEGHGGIDNHIMFLVEFGVMSGGVYIFGYTNLNRSGRLWNLQKNSLG